MAGTTRRGRASRLVGGAPTPAAPRRVRRSLRRGRAPDVGRSQARARALRVGGQLGRKPPQRFGTARGVASPDPSPSRGRGLGEGAARGGGSGQLPGGAPRPAAARRGRCAGKAGWVRSRTERAPAG